MKFADIIEIWEGSDGEATRRFYDNLCTLGPAGQLAMNLFRANKTSVRAKIYRGGPPGQPSYRRQSYDRKAWSINEAARLLIEHGETLGIAWGWREDPAQNFHRWVLYVDLPTGQVSFHTAARGEGPDYAAKWDGGSSPERICRWCARLLGDSKPLPAVRVEEGHLL